MGVLELIKKIKIKYPYKYVEPCPKCGSRCTGRYMKRPLTESDKEYIEIKSFENGEIIRFSSGEPKLNAFCVDCGNKWESIIRTIYITKEEKEDEKAARGTELALEALHEEISTKNSLSGNRKDHFI